MFKALNFIICNCNKDTKHQIRENFIEMGMSPNDFSTFTVVALWIQFNWDKIIQNLISFVQQVCWYPRSVVSRRVMLLLAFILEFSRSWHSDPCFTLVRCMSAYLVVLVTVPCQMRIPADFYMEFSYGSQLSNVFKYKVFFL